MSTSDLYLSITPLKISEIPAADVIIKAGREVLDSTHSWKQGKSYQAVKTSHRAKGPKDGTAWYCRASEHTKEDATFDEFWSKLGQNRAENEMQFIPELKKVKLIKQISPTQAIWTLYYRFSLPVSPRVFTVVQTTWVSESSPKIGIIISIPVDVTGDEELAKMEEKGVKGRYVSVERIQELQNGKVEWRMAITSTPGGNIPQFLADRSMASMISCEDTHFLSWLHKTRSAASAQVRAAAPATELHRTAPEVHTPVECGTCSQ